jgi:hypothetical protein
MLDMLLIVYDNNLKHGVKFWGSNVMILLCSRVQWTLIANS